MKKDASCHHGKPVELWASAPCRAAPRGYYSAPIYRLTRTFPNELLAIFPTTSQLRRPPFLPSTPHKTKSKMSDVAAPSSAAAPRAASSSLKSNYLLAYNAVSMFSWLSLLWHAGLVVKVWGLEYVHPHVDIFWKVTQSLAALEIVHSAFGRSPLCPRVCRRE